MRLGFPNSIFSAASQRRTYIGGPAVLLRAGGYATSVGMWSVGRLV